MPNSIALFKKYVDMLDEVYKLSSLTSALESDASLMRMGANVNEIIIPKLDMDGLADYSRTDGYVAGSITLTHETVTFNYDRGRTFSVDAMDDEESAGIAFGRLAAEFIRTKVVPELDAFRFATYAGITGISKAAGATLSDGAAVIAALRAATNKMDEDEVPTEKRYLYITPTLGGIVQDLDTTKSREVLNRFKLVTQVPQTRFYTAIDLQDGKAAGEEIGGYKKATAGKDINFMVFEPDALMQYTKHNVNKAISPQENQDDDKWKFFFRSYGLADVYENKVAGVYLHHKA